MTEWISNWASSVIVSVIIGTILEMILPNGNIKKYIKAIIGVYIVFSIIAPIISKLTGEDINISEEVSSYIESTTSNVDLYSNVETDNMQSIIDVYEEGLKDEIGTKLEEEGYVVNDVKIDIATDNTYTINNIVINVSKKDDTKTSNNNTINIESIEKIEIENNKIESNNQDSSTLSEKEKKEVKELICSNYDIDEDKITIN